MVVVATSAFGLGIDRPDIRCVFVTSPPTDVAALYQQLGRAGRDASGTIPGPGDPANIGITLATVRGFRTVEFLTRDLHLNVLNLAAQKVLRCGGLLDARRAADDLVALEVREGRLDPQRAGQDSTLDRYRTAVVRAVATLADLGAVDDLGDLPQTVRLTIGERPVPEGEAGIDTAFALAVQSIVTRDAEAALRTDVPRLHRELADMDVVADRLDAGATWAAIVELHHAGVLDVSQAPNRSWLTALRLNAAVVPSEYAVRIAARRQRAVGELRALRVWYADTVNCANQGLADYFAARPPGQLHADTCSTDQCRCSTCWGNSGGSAPDLLNALLHPNARLASQGEDRQRLRRLDDAIASVLFAAPAGVGPSQVWHCLKGDETYYNVQAQQMRPLYPPQLVHHKHFGSRPGVRRQSVLDALERLEAAGRGVLEGHLWYHQERIARRAAAQVAVQARVAAQAQAGGAS